eukprot:8138810-Pyramimonas_sp.AAC.1
MDSRGSEALSKADELKISDVARLPTPGLNIKAEVRSMATLSGAELEQHILSLHQRFWHAPTVRLGPLLLQAGA